MPKLVFATRVLLVCAISVVVASCSGGLDGGGFSDPASTDTTSVDGEDVDDGDAADSSDASPGGDGSEPGDELDGDADQPTLTEEELLGQLGQLQGQLAIGNGPQVAVARPDGLTLTELDGSEMTLAAQPTWSRDGSSLAWSSASADRQVVAVQTFDDEGLPTQERVESNASGPAVYYLQWNHDDTQLAYLRSGRRGRQVEFGTVEPGQPVKQVDVGAPFFISWSPSESELAANINQNSLALIGETAGSGARQDLVEIDGQFSAPAWIDESTVLAVLDGWFVAINVQDRSVDRLLDVGGAARFVLSPDRASFAFQSLEARQGGIRQASYQPSYQPSYQAKSQLQSEDGEAEEGEREAPIGLIVVDIATGSQQVVTTDTVLSWEWSPDSQKVAWLSTDRVSSQPVAQWHFWSRSPSEVIVGETPPLRLPRKVTAGYLPFFAQYTQSVTRWGPDSSAFAFEGVIEGRSGIWMQLVGEPATSAPAAPQLVASGDFVTWGYGPTPEPVPAGGPSPS